MTGRRILRILGGPLAAVVLLGILLANGQLEDAGSVLADARLLPVIGAVALLVVRDAVLDIARWSLALRALGHRVAALPLARVHLAGAAAKALLPAKLGEGVRVWMLHEDHGVPLKDGGIARLVAVGAIAGTTAAAWLGSWGPRYAAIAATGWGVAVLAGIAWKRLPILGLACAAVASLLAELGAWWLAWMAVGRPAVTASAVLSGILAGQVPIGLRGVGLRESALATPLGDAHGLSMALLVSAAELLSLAAIVTLGAALSRGRPTPGGPSGSNEPDSKRIPLATAETPRVWSRPE